MVYYKITLSRIITKCCGNYSDTKMLSLIYDELQKHLLN